MGYPRIHQSRFFLAWAALAVSPCFFAPNTCGQGRVTESRDGVSVTLPADEADLADEMLNIAKGWRGAFQKNLLSRAFEGYVFNPKAAENSRRRVAQHLGVEDEAGKKQIAQDWEEAESLVRRIADSLARWERGFDSFHFWTKAEAEAFRQRDSFVFQDTRTLVRDDGAGFRVWPGFFPDPIDLDALPDPQSVPPYRLDLVLAYRLGRTPGQIARQYHELLNSSHTDGKRGVVAQTASATFDAMYRRVFEKALERRIVRGDEGEFFRRALSLGFAGSINNQLDPDRGSKVLYGERLRRIASRELETGISDLAERIRKTAPWPSDSDGFAETATREIALAMVFSSLKNGGDTLDGWLRKQDAPLDAGAFSDRLARASGEDAWENTFRKFCGSLADQFATALGETTEGEPDPNLSAIEESWPRIVSGRVEVIHPPELAGTARSTAGKINALLDEYSLDSEGANLPRLSAEHRQWLTDRGLPVPDESAKSWTEIYRRAALGGISRLRIRLWFIDEAQAALYAGKTIPGFSVDADTRQMTISHTLGVQRVQQVGSDPGSANFDNPISSLIVPVPRDHAAVISPERQALSIETHCRELLDQLFTTARAGENSDERFFLVASYVAGEFLLREVIASENREWFVIGLSHWIAIQLTDLEFGPGAGRRVFESRWPPEKNEPDRARVDLMKWTSPTDAREDPLSAQNVYFATLAMHSALEEKDTAFLKRWIQEIQKTPYRRTHLGTVVRAYEAIGGGDLRSHAREAPRLPTLPSGIE